MLRFRFLIVMIMDWKINMIKQKCDRCGAFLGTESKKTKQRFCGKCKRKFQLHRYWKLGFLKLETDQPQPDILYFL